MNPLPIASILAALAPAPAAGPSQETLTTEELLQRVTELVERAGEEDSFSGSVAIARDGEGTRSPLPDREA